MDRAIKEIVPGIVQRSVSIATQTTKELVIKVLPPSEQPKKKIIDTYDRACCTWVNC